MNIAVTVFATGLRVMGADQVSVYAPTRAALYFCDQSDGHAPCLTTESGYVEWRGTLTLDCGGNVMLPPGGYRVVAVDGCEGRGLLRVEVVWAGPTDLNCDGVAGDDADIEALWNCLAGRCGAYADADFDHDGDTGTDADIARFYSLLAGAGQ